ncbi:hypothetical protein [Streptomyces ipomoeae]|uniref:hypothetical protein n=1 Tax=Streptomyces ipomoeae TaxID=103232 RepID=UPI0011465551|nr:hypothetical protein [Streptomyces ipomoeae]TQE19904.1 hypothetical protein Sipo7851_43280 [Streptomyces ipomoeae]
MTSRITTMDPPVCLALPSREPDPVSGCDICLAVANQRFEAKANSDRSKVTDCNVEINRHPHGRAE